MPRIENVGANVDQWYKETGGAAGSSMFDLCRVCFNKWKGKIVTVAGLRPFNGDPAGTVGTEEHPTPESYADLDYKCDACGRKLTSRDDSRC